MNPWPADWRGDPQLVARANMLVRQYGKDRAMAIVTGQLTIDDPLRHDLERWDKIIEHGKPMPPPKRG